MRFLHKIGKNEKWGVDMVHEDTIKLLRECDKGIKMGVSGIDDVFEDALSEKLKNALSIARGEHVRLEHEVESMLADYGDGGKEPGAFVKGMSKIKTNMKMAMHSSDSTIANLMVDGCNMGIKSLSKYLNEYGAAEERAKDVAKKLIALEEKLAEDMRGFL